MTRDGVELTEEERETLLCDCGGEDSTFCMAHGDRSRADPASMALDVTAEELVARVERIVAARVAEVEREREQHRRNALRWRDVADIRLSDMSAARAQLAAVAALADEYGASAADEPHGGALWSSTEAALRAALATPDVLLAERDAEKWREGVQVERARADKAEASLAELRAGIQSALADHDDTACPMADRAEALLRATQGSRDEGET